jgi:hypothetical protein
MPAGIYILLQSNIVQSYLGRKVSQYFTEKYQTEISIGQIDIRFFLNVELKNIYIADNHKNTLLKSDYIHINLDEFNLSSNYFSIKTLELKTHISIYIGIRGTKSSTSLILSGYL